MSLSDMLHETPKWIANILARHVPDRPLALLDPAVGNGSLVIAALGAVNRLPKRVCCLDIDPTVIGKVHEQVKDKIQNLIVLNTDFLEWVPVTSTSMFDCILMNPPFAGKLRDWVDVDVRGRSRRAPVEIAFLVKAIRLLKTNGCLIAVVPGSVVSNSRTRWFREFMVEEGSIEIVYELSRYSFKRVEGTFYVLVFRRTSGTRQIIFQAENEGAPGGRLVLTREDLTDALRLDYSHHVNRLSYSSCVKRHSPLGWIDLGSIATVTRGSISSPCNSRTTLHSTCYKNGFWKTVRLSRPSERSDRHAVGGDLLVKRVGRNCLKTIGLMDRDVDGLPCSDCLLIVRPSSGTSTAALLFAMRSTLAAGAFSRLLERGTGAGYITSSDLSGILVPSKLADVFSSHFAEYLSAVQLRDFAHMQLLESQVKFALMTQVSTDNYSECAAGRQVFLAGDEDGLVKVGGIQQAENPPSAAAVE